MKKFVKIKSFDFNSFKIGTKLVVGFLIVALLAVVVGAVGVFNMSKSNKDALQIYNARLIPIKNLSLVNSNLLQIRSNNIYMIYDKDLSKFDQRVQENTQWTNEDQVMIEEYEKTNPIGNEKVLLDKFKKDLIPYRAIREDFEEYMKNGNDTEGRKIIPELVRVREAVEEDIENLIEENNLQAELLLEDIEDNFRSSLILMIAVIVCGFGISIVLGLYLSRKISKPINEMLVASETIADGNLDVDLDVNSKDEIGEMAKAFKHMTDNLNKVMTNINSASEQVAAGAGQVSDSSTSLSQGATEQASSIEELTASIEEISSQTKQNAQNSNNAKAIAEKAKENAAQGNKQMQEMLTAMNEINDSSNNISKIIKVIDEIAFQTNILALNAAVEAARAGQHGRGFAVVAEEVRSLAARSANAAKETTTMIEDSIKNVEDGTKIANTTAGALNKIVDDISKAATLVGDIAVASNEQAIGVEQVNKGITQIAEVVQNTSATSEETAAASEELSTQAEMLKSQVSTFKLKNSSEAYLNEEAIVYKGLEDLNPEALNPEVLKMIENMKEKENINNSKEISLTDNEFGKY